MHPGRAERPLGEESSVVPKSANGSDGLVVLVVEDEVLVRAMIAQYLRDCDCVVLEADSAEEVAAIGRSGRAVDVLVTDINLSGPGNGWDVAEACRAAQPDMGVVYVSGNSVDRCRCVSGSLFFNKPYLDADILQACQVLSKRSSSAKSGIGQGRRN